VNHINWLKNVDENCLTNNPQHKEELEFLPPSQKPENRIKKKNFHFHTIYLILTHISTLDIHILIVLRHTLMDFPYHFLRIVILELAECFCRL
jgi:hypothetical protein